MEPIHSDAEFVMALNELEWVLEGQTASAKFSTDDIAAFGRLVAFQLGVPPTLIPMSDAHLLVFHRKDFSRLIESGLRFPSRTELNFDYNNESMRLSVA